MSAELFLTLAVCGYLAISYALRFVPGTEAHTLRQRYKEQERVAEHHRQLAFKNDQRR